MDHQIDFIGELKPGDLQHVASSVGSDSKDLGWVGFGIEIDDGDGMVEGVADDRIVDAVLASRPVDSTSMLYYESQVKGTNRLT